MKKDGRTEKERMQDIEERLPEKEKIVKKKKKKRTKIKSTINEHTFFSLFRFATLLKKKKNSD